MSEVSHIGRKERKMFYYLHDSRYRRKYNCKKQGYRNDFKLNSPSTKLSNGFHGAYVYMTSSLYVTSKTATMVKSINVLFWRYRFKMF